jgi:hypothetical protein
MLSGANRDRYAALKADFHNQYGFGTDLYPKSPDRCLSLLNRRSDTTVRTPRRQQQQHDMPLVKEEDHALVFAQGNTNQQSPQKSNDDKSKQSTTSSSSSRNIRIIKCKNRNQIFSMFLIEPLIVYSIDKFAKTAMMIQFLLGSALFCQD